MCKAHSYRNRVVLLLRPWLHHLHSDRHWRRLLQSSFIPKPGPEGSQLQNVLGKLTGQYIVPNVFIGDKHIGGCSDTLQLYNKGELEAMLAEANGKTGQT